MHLFYTGIILFLEIKNYIIQKQNLHSYVKFPKEDNENSLKSLGVSIRVLRAISAFLRAFR